jgi:hypothetical protein
VFWAAELGAVVLNAGSPTVPPTAELELTGANIGDGVVAHWSVEGELTVLSVPTPD